MTDQPLDDREDAEPELPPDDEDDDEGLADQRSLPGRDDRSEHSR
jgi:hypothetical protein